MCREELARLVAVHPADEIAEAAARAAAAAAEQQATAAALAERDHAALTAAAECELVYDPCWAPCMTEADGLCTMCQLPKTTKRTNFKPVIVEHSMHWSKQNQHLVQGKVIPSYPHPSFKYGHIC
jgi:hypothetical protein